MEVEERNATFAGSVIMLGIVIMILVTGIIFLGLDAQIPILISSTVLMIYGKLIMKIRWNEMRDSIVESIATAIEVMIIILLIGCTVGTWISSGTVPMIIYYGLQIFSPRFFWACVVVICAVMSLVTGSSWTTMGTVGVAFMGVGSGLGLHPAITAGAIVCGAYFGDKQSPLSDTTNFAAAVAGTDLYKHVKSMMFTTGPALLITVLIYFVMGIHISGSSDLSSIQILRDGLDQTYRFNFILIIPVIFMIGCMLIKIPAIPTLIGCTLMGAFCTVLVQGETVSNAMSYIYSGFVGNTGNETLDSLLTRGGMTSMYYTIALMIMSLTMAGLLQRTGIMNCLVGKISSVTQKRQGLIFVQIITGFALSYIAADPYLSMLLSANAYADRYDELGLDRCILSRTLEDSGTLVCPMVPWGSNGVYTATALGVATVSYLPYYFMGFITPVFSILCAFTGIGIFYKDKGKERKHAGEYISSAN